MRISTLCMATMLAVGSVGLAYAAPTINNGNFSQQNIGTPHTSPWQFGSNADNGTSKNHGFDVEDFLTDWYGNDGYEIWFNNANDAVNVEAHSIWGQGSSADTGKEMLYGPISNTYALTGDTFNLGSFVGLDGEQTAGVQSSISQDLTGLTIGARYTLSFDWSAAQVQSRTGDTTSALLVSFGDQSHTFGPEGNPSESFTGWWHESYSFIADSTDATLSFLSVGTPLPPNAGLPPMALLTNVNLSSVPEPSVLGMFGGGLLGLGLLTLFARRRALRRRLDEEGGELV